MHAIKTVRHVSISEKFTQPLPHRFVDTDAFFVKFVIYFLDYSYEFTIMRISKWWSVLFVDKYTGIMSRLD